MGFESLLGNDRIRENLAGSLSRNRISHFYLISGPEGSGKHTLARLLAAGILCKSRENRPCLRCEACRKVLDGAHPDFITVDDPEKKTVPVDLIRQARADIYIQPNEAEHKIYLFPRAQDMGLPGQNALLKVLEEPPGYGVFLLLTDNPEKLLPTVRSRCVELAMQPLPAETLQAALRRAFPDRDGQALAAAAARSGGYLGQARKLLEEGDVTPPQTAGFADAFCRRDRLALLETLVPMEKQKRDTLEPLLDGWRVLLEEALVCRSGMPVVSPRARRLAESRSAAELMEAQRQLSRAVDAVRGNVSPAAVCGYLEWALQAPQ